MTAALTEGLPIAVGLLDAVTFVVAGVIAAFIGGAVADLTWLIGICRRRSQ